MYFGACRGTGVGGGGEAVACMYYTVYVNVLWGKGEGQIELVM